MLLEPGRVACVVGLDCRVNRQRSAVSHVWRQPGAGCRLWCPGAHALPESHGRHVLVGLAAHIYARGEIVFSCYQCGLLPFIRYGRSGLYLAPSCKPTGPCRCTLDACCGPATPSLRSRANVPPEGAAANGLLDPDAAR